MRVNGEIILKEMRKRGIKITELARTLGYTHGTVSKWIHGRQGCTRSNIIRICDYLELDTTEVTGRKKIPLKKFETVDYALMILKLHNWHGTL